MAGWGRVGRSLVGIHTRSARTEALTHIQQDGLGCVARLLLLGGLGDEVADEAPEGGAVCVALLEVKGAGACSQGEVRVGRVAAGAGVGEWVSRGAICVALLEVMAPGPAC